MNRGRGFTLIELTAVLLIVALLSSVIGVSLASVSRRTTLRDAVSALADLDRSMRMECVDDGRTGALRFDSEEGRVECSIRRGDETVQVAAYQFPVGTRLAWVRTTGEPGAGRSADPAVIACNQEGRTPTYAFAIAAGESNGSEPVRVVVSGLTGQVREVRDESQIKALFATLAGGDAH